jgi:two-component system phosphate regulon response regulator PhoB
MPFRPKILVVEADLELQQILVTTMRHMGAEACCVEKPETVKSLVETEKFDGAFVDWDCHNFNPEELTVQIRKSKSNARIPVAMLSTRPDQIDAVRGFKVGATFFLAKPFGSKELECLLNATRGAMLEERRRYQRVAVNISILCEWKDGRNSKHVAGRSMNISSTGVLMKMTPRPETGVAVAVEVGLPRPQARLALKAMVVRSGPGENVALRFLQLTKGQQEQLENFITGFPASTSGLFSAA